MPSYERIREWLESENSYHAVNIPGYDFWVYLRHHGFPSPLLDWTRSPYIAAFFAYSSEVAEKVAIYVYRERDGAGKAYSYGEPKISVQGRYVRSHSRHFLQQSEYTVCLKMLEDQPTFTQHESVFSAGSTHQDRLWKIILPSSERISVLSDLDKYNLNAFSLFQNEEALLSTVSFRQIEMSAKHF